MSLVDENEFEYNTTLPADYTFAELFSANIYLKNHLEKPLVLPATSLTISCYMSMFEGCSGLTTAPELPAKRLATGCYSNMFNGCNNLRSAPELLATTLTKNCYKEMFKKCNNLNYVKCLATDISAGGCTTDWLSGAAESGIFVKSAKTEWSTSASGIPVNWTVKSYTSAPALTLEAIAGGIITVYNPKEGMQYSIDGGTKTEMTATTEIPVTAGQKVQFYGNGTSITQYGIFNKETRIQCSADCYIYGNIMSLVDENDFEYNTTLTGDDVFQKLFYNSGSNYTQLKNHPDKPLVLPATTLAKGCYAYMFYGCKGLTTAPELPATTMTYACYTYMFQGCIGLIKAPKLPAKELATYCYLHMFNGCTGLTAAPELPATELADNCYYSMFYECTGLTTAPKLSATTLTNHCYASMFYGCRSLTTAPELPATTLAPGCYRSMFERCTSLNYVKCLATDISAEECTLYWLKTVAAQGTFMKADNTNWNTGGDGIPEGWMVVGPNGIALYDTADNTATLMDNDEKTVDYVVLAGRTLYKDGKWNTLCLPFDVSDGDNYDGITFTGTPLEGTTAVELNSSSFDSGTLTLNFSGVDAITAGKPYLVKWAPTGTNLQNPIFYNVAIHKDAGAIGTEVIHFYGTFVSTTYAAEDRSILFLGADNTLYYPEAGATIGACRAYFELADGLTCGDPNNPNSIRTFNLNFGDGSEQTGITTTNITNFTNSDAWYSVDGVRLSGQPTTPGLYIHGGKKVAIK